MQNWWDIDAQSCFTSQGMPDLGLAEKLDAEWRVYVLRCADGALYVGLARKAWIGRRIQQHFNGKGSHFTQRFTPSAVCLVWPARTRAVEAYAYFGLLETVSRDRCKRVGGWTQTSSKLSPLANQLVQEARRGLEGCCFTCGGSHVANEECPRKGQQPTCWYPCKHCGEKLYLTSRGHTPDVMAAQAESSVQGDCLPSAKRPADAKTDEATLPPRKLSKMQGSACPRVDVCGQAYATLAWYTGRMNPLKSHVAAVEERCFGRAVELSGGDSKTLLAQSFAKTPPHRGEELLLERERLPHDWVDTGCSSVRSARGVPICKKYLQVRKARAGSSGACKLWRLDDLEAALG